MKNHISSFLLFTDLNSVLFCSRCGEFASRCNTELVSLDKVEEENDKTKLYGIIKEHFYHTKSSVAKELLESWSLMVEKFVKV